jgi:hypothetical protein
MVFPPQLKEIDVMAKWVKDAIQTHQCAMTSHLNIDLVLLSTPPPQVSLQ